MKIHHLNHLNHLNHSPMKPSLASTTTATTPSRSIRFPLRLHQVLNEAESKGFGTTLQWIPDGSGFAILNRRAMENDVIPLYFSTGKYRSFLRNLNLYEFQSRKDPSTSQKFYSHPLFHRDHMDLCKTMHREIQSSPNARRRYRKQKNKLSGSGSGTPDEPRPVLSNNIIIAAMANGNNISDLTNLFDATISTGPVPISWWLSARNLQSRRQQHQFFHPRRSQTSQSRESDHTTSRELVTLHQNQMDFCEVTNDFLGDMSSNDGSIVSEALSDIPVEQCLSFNKMDSTADIISTFESL